MGIMATGDLPLREETLCLRATLLIHSSEIDSELVHSDRLRQIQMDPSKYHHKSLGYFLVIMFYQTHGCDVITGAFKIMVLPKRGMGVN